MALKLFNTLARSVQEFTPLDPQKKKVGMYCCGPTVYDFAHIGNARPVIVFDVLFRLLRRLYGEARPMDPLAGRRPDRHFAGNPVYRLGALEVTVWDFARARLRCLNLFPDGSITEEYELARSRLAA